MTARIGVIVFPGTNCEHDVVRAVRSVGGEAELLWGGGSDLGGVDAVVIPGGFAHGDYLRPGAIARISPIMAAVADFAAEGGPVVGICNGFQVLTEAALLPGALQRNAGLRFVCDTVPVEVCSTASVLTSGAELGSELRLPVNHFEGRFVADAETVKRLREEGRVILRYSTNPNGSIDDIAGVVSEGRNVVGLMPHPERACDPLLGSTDGAVLLRSLLESSSGATSTAPAATTGG